MRKSATKTRVTSPVDQVVGGNGDVAQAVAALDAVTPARGSKGKNVGMVIPRLNLCRVHLNLVGETPLIVHAWSVKARDAMFNKQTGKASGGKTNKNPVDDFRGSLYLLSDGSPGFPTSAFKACAVTAANDVELRQTETKRAFRTVGALVAIMAPPHTPENKEFWLPNDELYKKELAKEHKQGLSMREDMVRLQTGVADIRFRGQFPIWSVRLEVILNQSVMSVEQLVGLYNCAGFGCGIGEWRASAPESKSGSFGGFRVEGEAEITGA